MNNVKISNTNGNSYQKSCVRVYVNNIIVGELYYNAHNPLSRLQERFSSKYYVQLCDELENAIHNNICTLAQAKFIKREIFPLIVK